ncbi:MAG: phage portal protein [Solirubrobacterales bacterium]
MLDQVLLQNCFDEFLGRKDIFDKMYEYYKGNSDAIKNYKLVTQRSNNKTSVNYMKKFIKEEVSYSVGNDITYISKSSNGNIIRDIDYYTAHWSEKHDSDLAKIMLTFGFAYELYYTDNKSQFCSKIITPREGYAYVDDVGNILFFMHIYQKKFDSNTYIDVYDDNNIYHYDKDFKEIGKPDVHIFNVVPVGIAQVSIEQEEDTIYKDIKGLQDAYETNLSDISNEISDFRNAYLFVSGFQIDKDDLPNMKELGVIQVQTPDGKAAWLIKNINDSFIQNTLSTIEDKIYQLTSHINHNEKMQSNLSGVALRSRLISLEEKCKLNQKAIADCIKVRLKMLFVYLKFLKSIDYDYKDIKAKFTPNIPQDDLNTAQIINQLGDKLSTETGLGLLSFINNPANELEKIKKQNAALKIGADLLNSSGGGTGE